MGQFQFQTASYHLPTDIHHHYSKPPINRTSAPRRDFIIKFAQAQSKLQPLINNDKWKMETLRLQNFPWTGTVAHFVVCHF